MANAWLKDALSMAAETVEVVLDNVEEIGTKILEALEELDDRLDRVLNDEQAQPAAPSAPVEPSLNDKVDYIYDRVKETIGFHGNEKASADFKNALYDNPDLTDKVYEQYQTEGAGSGWE